MRLLICREAAYLPALSEILESLLSSPLWDSDFFLVGVWGQDPSGVWGRAPRKIGSIFECCGSEKSIMRLLICREAAYLPALSEILESLLSSPLWDSDFFLVGVWGQDPSGVWGRAPRKIGSIFECCGSEKSIMRLFICCEAAYFPALSEILESLLLSPLWDSDRFLSFAADSFDDS